MKDGMMKALMFKGPKHFEVEERPIPACGPDEILVRVRYGGVCGTDNRIYQGTKIIEAPRITGHHPAGQSLLPAGGQDDERRQHHQTHF